MDLGLKGKVAIVTGTGRQGAMGHTIAKTLAAEGADIACVDINIEGAEAIAKELVGMGVKAIAYNVNQSEHQQVVDGVAKIKADLGPPDILVNNAALLRGGGRIQTTTVEDWKTNLKINLDGPWHWIREVWDMMVEKKWGRIVNISSIVGLIGNVGQCNYSASKAGVIGFTKSLAREVASRGITVNAVAPGYIATPMTESLPESVQQKFRDWIPVKRFGTPEEITHAVKFLLSDEAAYITGQVINVNGGMYM